ncbi:MAG: hypothetical protein K2X43_17690 [Hyphomonadaceae bacterium]|jgi:predicted esterase|nr:hypothetical protein [Hyphomonadaceae bacterium]
MWGSGGRWRRLQSSASRAFWQARSIWLESVARPSILLIRREADDLIPVAALHVAREELAKIDLLIDWHVRPGVGHGFDQEAQIMAGPFIASAVKGLQRAR